MEPYSLRSSLRDLLHSPVWALALVLGLSMGALAGFVAGAANGEGPLTAIAHVSMGLLGVMAFWLLLTLAAWLWTR